ncbi:MAG: transketolase C-terminal domain-containing protein, partial [Pseudomonadota bacterium]|nr:transketolase C-terminal domain-containing protein [Pseudomonadota bacterium]
LGWEHAPFDVPQPIVESWRAVGARGRAARQAWEDRHKASDSAAFDAAMAGDFDGPIGDAVLAWKQALAAEPQKIATRVASQKALDAIIPACPALIGGSADLTGSNNTRAGGQDIYSRDNPAGTYVHYGVREHGMAAAMNGIALHGGAIPYGGTFLVFTDYCRPSIRLSALMRQRVVYVMTHDSIGLGEDGPTHQPVEHLAALRAIPNLLVFRPGDAVETAEAWQCALAAEESPSILALSRQGLAQFRLGDLSENMTARGAYIAAGEAGGRQVTLMASGSEVGIAMSAREMLAADGIAATVVSVPCMELFWQQDEAWRNTVLGTAPRIAVEAAIRQPWDRILGENDGFVGMDDFGASAPAGDLFPHFGITAEAVAAAARKRLG